MHNLAGFTGLQDNGSVGPCRRGPRKLRVGGTTAWPMAATVAMTSNTPAAPCAWPRCPLVELTGGGGSKTWFKPAHSAGSLAAVPVPCALT